MHRAFASAPLLLATLFLLGGTASSQTIIPTGTTVWFPPYEQPGNTFFNAPDGIARMVDASGQIVNQWGTPESQLGIAKPIFDPGGHILAMTGFVAVPHYPRPRATRLVQFDASGRVFFEFDVPVVSVGTLAGIHHDMERLENGNTLILCSTLVDIPAISPKTLVDDCIVEQTFSGDVVWEWYTHQHFDQFGFSDEAKAQIADAAGDWAHANSLSVIPPNDIPDPAFTPGNIMVSYRQLNTIIVIDRATGAIVWKLGPADSITIGQHDAHVIHQGLQGAGRVLAFDNGLSAGYPLTSRAFSRVVEIDPISKTVVWVYTAAHSGLPFWSFFSPIISGAQRLPNGNTLITEGTKGRLFEVMPNGPIAWEYISPFYDLNPGPGILPVKDFGIFRAYRMPPGWGLPSTP